MESGISELIAAFKERIKRPFYWAFIFSWLVVNWRILIIIFAYDNTLCKDGIINCIESQHLTYKKMICFPLLGAGIYTLIFPFFDIAVTYVSEVFFKGLILKIRFSKRAPYSGVEMKLKEDKISKLETQLNHMQEVRNNLDSAQKQLEYANNSLQQKEAILKESLAIFDESYFMGDWNVRLKKTNSDPLSSNQLFTIRDSSNYLSLSQITKQGEIPWGSIVGYSIRHQNTHLIMLKHDEGGMGLLYLNRTDDPNRFAGRMESTLDKYNFIQIDFVREK